MGTPEFAVPSLDILVRHGYTIPAVVTAPDKPRGRGQQVTPTSVKIAALHHSIPVLQPESLRDASFLGQLNREQPDLIVVVAFRILPKEVFTLARLGSFNLHASLLPKYRGAAPINWAIINGETETGVTTFFLEEKVDTGTILLQKSTTIGPEEDAGTLHDRLAALGAGVVLETVRLIEEGNAMPRRQDDACASAAPKIRKDDCRIVWSKTAGEVHNFIRGMSPHPAAFVLHGGKVLKLYRSHVTDLPASAEPGTVDVAAGRLSVHTSDRLLTVLELQAEGKRRLGVEEFLRGYRISSGEKFT